MQDSISIGGQIKEITIPEFYPRSLLRSQMNWQSYEDLVRYIYEELGRASNVKILCHGSSCKVPGWT